TSKPARPAGDPKDEPGNGEVVPPPDAGQAEPAAEDQIKRILIADDEGSIRTLLREFLEEEGFQVAEAETGQQVLRALAEGGYDLIMMDIRMPEMDGLAVLKEMHAKKFEVPIIVMTAHNSANIAIQATQLGAYDYITKPFELDE